MSVNGCIVVPLTGWRGGEGGGSTRDRQREGFLIRKVASLEKRLTTINKLLKGDGATAKEGEKEEAQRVLDALLTRCVNWL